MNRCINVVASSAVLAGLVAGALGAGAGVATAAPQCPPGAQNCQGGGPGGPGGPGGQGGRGPQGNGPGGRDDNGPGNNGPGGHDNNGPGNNGPGGHDNNGPGGGPQHDGTPGWHPERPPALPPGVFDRPAPRDGDPAWGWGPGQGNVPNWAHARPGPPWWAPFARVYWSDVRNSWGFWWGPFWFPAY